jgi:thiosulfate/3-mercaptopyruvate sulfurtransferase
MGQLISATELIDRLRDPGVRVVDCRWYLMEPAGGRGAFEAGHIPGAVYADLDRDLSARSGAGRHPLPTPEAFAATMGLMGIDRSTFVVAYDDRGGAIAARLWWMLTSQGHDTVTVLDGGIQAWTDLGGDLSTVVIDPVPTSFEAQAWTGTVTIDEVADRPATAVVLDARDADRYAGDVEPVDPKAGHIPGALSQPMTGNLGTDLRFRPPPVLADGFGALGIDRRTHVITHCGSGVTACHTILAAEIAGLPRPDLYVGSWSDWSSTDRPVATGTHP